jgi:hypothetical protein
VSPGHIGPRARARAAPWLGSSIAGERGAASASSTRRRRFVHVVKARQASYHPLGTEPLQGIEVKVPEALVPLLRLVVPTSSKAERLCYLHVEDVESIGASSYLGKKATMAILNPHDSVLDLHTRTVLIQLSQVDDRVSQRGDVIDFG